MTSSSSTPIGRWDGIDEFVQSVSSGSFTAAAEKLGVSKSHVSKQVGRLEARLNARLLQRSTRNLTLTDVGEILYRECSAISQRYDALESIVADLQNRPSGTLKLAINSRFGVQYMAGAIASFARLYPDISIQVHASYRDVDLIAEGFDLTIRYGDLDDSSLVARKLGGYTMSLYAAPEYWDKFGIPETMAALRSHNGLCPPDRHWNFSSADGTKRVRASGNWVSEDGTTLLAAAKEGLGIAQLPDFFVKNEVARGELKKLPQAWNFYWRSAWAVYSGNQHVAAKVRFFIDYLCKSMAGDVWLELKKDFYQRKPGLKDE